MEFDFWYIWVILGVVLLVLEIFIPGFFMALIGVAALLTGVVTLITPNFLVQLLVFGGLVTVFLIFVKPFVMKHLFKKDQIKGSNVDGMIGKVVNVTDTIDNNKDTGYIKYYGDVIPARSESDEVFPAGTRVQIKRVEGIKVWVVKPEPKKEAEE